MCHCVLSSFVAEVLPEVLPKCDYFPSYARVHKVKRYTGLWSIMDSFVYPDDHTELKVYKGNKWKAEGNPLIEESVCSLSV